MQTFKDFYEIGNILKPSYSSFRKNMYFFGSISSIDQVYNYRKWRHANLKPQCFLICTPNLVVFGIKWNDVRSAITSICRNHSKVNIIEKRLTRLNAIQTYNDPREICCSLMMTIA